MKNKAHSNELDEKVRRLAAEVEETGLNNPLEPDSGAVAEKDTSIDEDALNSRIEELKAEIHRLEESNREFRMKVVDLHTEIQDKDAYIRKIEDDVSHDIAKLIEIQDILKCSVDGVIEVIRKWLNSDKSPLVNLTALVDIANVLNEQDNKAESAGIRDSSPPSLDDIPGIIKDQLEEIEKSLNKDLPAGVSVTLAPRVVSQKKMSEMLKIANEG